MKVPLDVVMGLMELIPVFSILSCTSRSGLGVILSIMVRGKLTFSSIQLMKSSVRKPLAFHSSAIVRMLSMSLSPLWLQLSMLTKARGFLQLLYLARSKAQTRLIAWVQLSGPFSISDLTTFKKSPSKPLRA